MRVDCLSVVNIIVFRQTLNDFFPNMIAVIRYLLRAKLFYPWLSWLFLENKNCFCFFILNGVSQKWIPHGFNTVGFQLIIRVLFNKTRKSTWNCNLKLSVFFCCGINLTYGVPLFSSQPALTESNGRQNKIIWETGGGTHQMVSMLWVAE